MVALFCPLEMVNTEPIQLFVKLVDAKLIEDITPLKVPGVSIDRRLSMCNFDIDLNIRYLDQYSGGATSTWPQNSHHVVLQIHLIVIETDAHDEDGFNNNFGFNHGDEDFNGPDVNDILNDIENEGADDENYYTPLVRNSSHGIVIRNDLGSYMPIVNPDAKQASKFLSTLDIIPAHMMLADSKPEELFIG
ncbi:hypothetical protein GOBAR_AA39347 [Gossypium barbadense]|uniref:Uncharacterized protein n=1 Tax=Gossypium barbadense TaxID=3634 RepID=A0A2P5VR95_GOSBA|nr:hypothetical protein GOBAR_AA39347 [Gossypium barbadense]